MVFRALAVVLAGLAVLCQWRIGFNNDNAWLLYAARRLTEGARLYVDVVEINPPLIVWLNLPVVWLAQWVDLDPVGVFRSAVVLASLASAAACERLARPGRLDLPSGAMFCLCILVLLALPVTSFGQREHLLLVLVLPYLVLRGARQAGVPGPAAGTRALVGLAAGVGIALKPQFAGVWALALCLRDGSIAWPRPRVEDGALLALGIGYLLAVLALTPEYLPLVRLLGGTYADYRTQGLAPILFGRFEALATLLALAMYAVYRRTLRSPALADPVAAGIVGALLGLVLQGKGFEYHYYPALGLAVVLLGVLAVSTRSAGRDGTRARLVPAILLGVIAGVYVEAGARIALGPEHAEMRAYRALERAVGPVAGTSVMVLAPRSGYAFGLVTYAGARWVGRFPCLWVPPVLYPDGTLSDGQYRMPDAMAAVERWFLSSVVADAVEGQPEVILVGRPTPGQGPRDYWFDFLDYLQEDARFARLMSGYRRTGEAAGYLIYRRVTPPSGA